MIKSLFTNSDYNKRFLKILEIYKKLRDVKTEVNTLVKKGIQSTMILKKARIFKNQNNFLTLKLSTVYYSIVYV